MTSAIKSDCPTTYIHERTELQQGTSKSRNAMAQGSSACAVGSHQLHRRAILPARSNDCCALRPRARGPGAWV
jgi:hypothetical protein